MQYSRTSVLKVNPQVADTFRCKILMSYMWILQWIDCGFHPWYIESGEIHNKPPNRMITVPNLRHTYYSTQKMSAAREWDL